jgi:excinuclease ABC subunit A
LETVPGDNLQVAGSSEIPLVRLIMKCSGLVSSIMSASQKIRLRGVRQNNLKNIDLDLPLNRLIVLTGLSGSGKSSLAFDTLFAEGQRRYIETFSPYARQFFDRMDKPKVDSIEGIPPAIALEQRNAVRTTRSTVGTMTEICDYMKLIWLHLAELECRQCHRTVRKDTPQSIWQTLSPGLDVLVAFDLPLSEKLTLSESLDLVRRQGYQRLLIDGRLVRVEDAPSALAQESATMLTVIQDRLRVQPAVRSRFVDACEQAFHFGKGRLAVYPDPADLQVCHRFSQHLHCASCDLEYREPVPALFSFNHPLGACPACRGFGRIITIDYNLALPDHSRTLAEGVVKPWHTGQGAECQTDMLRFARKRGVPLDIPFAELPVEWKNWLIEGDPGYGTDEAHEWPRAWYGVKGYFRWLESKAYKMHVRVLLSRYRAYSNCPDCHGRRFQPEALLYRVGEGPSEVNLRKRSPEPLDSGAGSERIDLAQFYAMTVSEALAWVSDQLVRNQVGLNKPIALALGEVQSRLSCLVDVGLGYLTLDRATRTLSGGETQRVNLTSCLGTRLVNTLYVLDEPSVGLHPRDIGRLIRVLLSLRDLGNTVVVVEHEASIIQAADQIVDLGPGQGERGGHVVYQGTYAGLLKSHNSMTGQYLNGSRSTPTGSKRRSWDPSQPSLSILNACRHNLQNLNLEIPLGRLVCVTGVSGSGKTTLVREIIHPQLSAALNPNGRATEPVSDVEESERTGSAGVSADASLRGGGNLGRVVMVDQSPIGRTPRSNPAVYTGAFDAIRDLFAQSPEARQRGLKASSFSFNSLQGQCERCRGAGYEKIEMQFLSDVYIRCPQCDGKRYRPHVLEVRLPLPGGAGITNKVAPSKRKRRNEKPPAAEWSIAEFLEATTDDVVAILERWGEVKAARQALQTLELIQQVGLGYLRLGQPLTTLSGGENQRLKLAGHLAEFRRSKPVLAKSTLFIFDEPTTGLHFEDVRILLEVFHGLVNAGHSLLVVEHNLQVIQEADWVIDLGPEAGDAGGRLVAVGPPENIASCEGSHTGAALRSCKFPTTFQESLPECP